MSRLGKRINEERIKKGITPKQLGKKCGVAESYILDIESGRKIINDKLISQISKILGVNLDDNTFDEAPQKEVEKPITATPGLDKSTRVKRSNVEPLPQWEGAFTNIIKEVPIYKLDMTSILGYKSFPIINKKVEGFNPDKLIYINAPDESLSQYRIFKGDRCLIYLNQEIKNGGFHFIEYEQKKLIRKVKRLDGNTVQLIEGLKDEKSIKVNIKNIKVLGRLIRVEIDF